jgi:Histidine kinase-, DNA gyrase B-, and HSP90-like ATPase
VRPPTNKEAPQCKLRHALKFSDCALQSTGWSRHVLKSRSESQIFTKLADVKSRLRWPAERRKQLQKMWDRGDKAADIAAALGCKVGAVNVARARFGLKPRRKVSGRPKEPPDEPAHKIERVAFTTSRLMEFASEKELVAQTGHESYEWLRYIIKELVDNGLDECEEAEVAPSIKVTIRTGKSGRPTRIVVEDNGRGIPTETIAGIIDYKIRISSREAYISPTRGRQGNALKTILPMAYVLGGRIKGETWIEARGLKHRILFTVNQIGQEPVVKNIRTRSRVRTGTRVTVFWPSEMIETDDEYGWRDNDPVEIDHDAISELLREFIWVNPHLTLRFTVDGMAVFRHDATNPNWPDGDTKYRACDATSAHWYSLEQFERYAGALIARDLEFRKRHPASTREKTTVRDFIAQFRGMKATEKQKLVLRELGAAHMSLSRFFGSEMEVNHQRMKKLLGLIQKHTRPVRPELLGIIGEEHFRRLMPGVGGEPKSFKYFLSPSHNADGLPYVVEIATCPFKQWVAGKKEQERVLVTGVNFSATLENPFDTFRDLEGMDEILTNLRAGTDAPVIVCVHYTCPHIEYLDRGKRHIGLE